MKIYRVYFYIQERPARGRNKGRIVTTERGEEIIVNNIEHAKSVFSRFKNKVELDAQHANVRGAVELFEPHVFANGELAYYPDNEQYIDQYIKEF